MYKLQTQSMQLFLHAPQDGFYRGTRFDRAGVWDSLLLSGVELCGRWFTRYAPFMHDAVCGPAEEFFPVFTEDGEIVKIGVGLLKPDSEPYDRFKLYPFLSAGQWDVQADEKAVLYCHRLEGFYEYEKAIVLSGECSFEIRHALKALVPLDTQVYNHNFFTLGKMAVGPSRQLDFPFRPEGTWRAQYDSVGFTPSGIRFSRSLKEGESVFTGDIHEAGGDGMPYRLTLREEGITVHIEGSMPVTHTVMWANHRIACPEPYNHLRIAPGETARWSVSYGVELSDTESFTQIK